VRGGGALLTAQRKAVLILAAHMELLGHVLAGLRHGVHAVLRAQALVDEAPADRRIENFRLAAESDVRFRYHERRARHRFHAACDDDTALPTTDCARGERHRSEEHTSELQSREKLVCRLLLEKEKK